MGAGGCHGAGAYAGAKLNPSGKFHIFDEDNWAGSTGNRLSGAFFDGAMSSTARRLMGGGKQDWRSIAIQAAGQTAGETLTDWARYASRRDDPKRDPIEKPIISQNPSMEFNVGAYGMGPYVSNWGTSLPSNSSLVSAAEGEEVQTAQVSRTTHRYGLNDRARMAIANIERAARADMEEMENLPPGTQQLDRIFVTANGGWWNNGSSADILRNIARYAPSYYGRASTIKWNGDTNRYVAKYGQWANDTHPNGFFAVPIGASREQAMQYYQANTARHDLMNRQFLSVVSSGMVKAPQVRSMTYEEVMAADGKTIRSLPGSLVKAAVNFVADFAQMTSPIGAIQGSMAALSGAPAPDWKPFEMTSAADQIATFYFNAASVAVGGEGLLFDTALIVRGAPRFVANTTRQLSREAFVALDTMTAKAGDLARKVPVVLDELGAKAGNLADRLRTSRLAAGADEVVGVENSGRSGILSSSMGFSETGNAKFDRLFAESPQFQRMANALEKRGISLVDDASRLGPGEKAFITRSADEKLQIVYDKKTTTFLDMLHEARHGMQVQKAEASGILGEKSAFKTEFKPMWERGAYEYELRLGKRFGFSEVYKSDVQRALINERYNPGYERQLFNESSTKYRLMKAVEPKLMKPIYDDPRINDAH